MLIKCGQNQSVTEAERNNYASFHRPAHYHLFKCKTWGERDQNIMLRSGKWSSRQRSLFAHLMDAIPAPQHEQDMSVTVRPLTSRHARATNDFSLLKVQNCTLLHPAHKWVPSASVCRKTIPIQLSLMKSLMLGTKVRLPPNPCPLPDQES